MGNLYVCPGGRNRIIVEPKFLAEVAKRKTEHKKRDNIKLDIKEEKSKIHKTALEETLASGHITQCTLKQKN